MPAMRDRHYLPLDTGDRAPP